MSDGVTDARRDGIRGGKNELKQNQKRSAVWQGGSRFSRPDIHSTSHFSDSFSCH